MKTPLRQLLAAGLALAAGSVSGQSIATDPNLGYLYPAGGERGQTIEVLAGGQRLNGVKSAIVTGEGVEVEVVQWYRQVRNVNGDQRKLLTKLLQDREEVLTGTVKRATPWKKPAGDGNRKTTPGKKASPSKKTSLRGNSSSTRTIATTGKAAPNKKASASDKAGKAAAGRTAAKTDEKKEEPPVKLPDHPLLEDIDTMSLRELAVVRRTFLRSNRNQLNPQIAEMVKLRIKIAPDAKPGDRTIRLLASGGLTNPLCFQVGALPEWVEQEPNEPRSEARLKLPPLKPLALPVVVNGQILPGDIDRISFRARGGESIVVDARARQLIPYLADAVPGWFQMVVTLFDEKGKELAFADDFRFHPDPLLRFKIPADGVYQLEVRDSIYRGRQDFVYRIRVGKVPVITEMFPLGTQQGRVSKGKLRGWNLPVGEVTFDPGGSGGAVRKTSLIVGGECTNAVYYAVDPLPQTTEVEPNDKPANPHQLKLPMVVNGRIDKAGDVDVFAFHGRKGEEVVAEVQARRLNSPLDSKLTILDPRGASLVHNDDFMVKDGHLHMGPGLLTHHADSYLRTELPEDGLYFVLLGDSQGHGGSAYAYRLRLSPPRPHFSAMVTPSAVLANIGGHTPLRFHVDRQDGFTGPVDIELVDAPNGWRLHGARIPAASEHVRATLEAPRLKPSEPIELRFRAVAKRGDQELTSPVEPADDRMQAFLWRHLVSAEQFLVMPRWRGNPPVMAVESDGPARLVPGTTTDVRVKTTGANLPLAVRLVASEPPPGIVVEDFGLLSDGFVLKLRAEKSAQPGMAGNLIIEGWMHPEAKPGKGKNKASRPYMVGVLPPIPFVVQSP